MITPKYKSIGVMCGSSDACPSHFHELAREVGRTLGRHGHDIVYGGGARGLMREVADGAMEEGAHVTGYMPTFMVEVEWQHKGLARLEITKDMSERKQKMMRDSNATLFLPGGCGTMEEFFEWLSAKRLGKHLGPLIIVNHQGYYDPLIQLLNNMQQEAFHNPVHERMWQSISAPEEIAQALNDAHPWDASYIKQAASVKS